MDRERIVYIARLKPQYREAYLEAHRNVPEALMSKYRDAGIVDAAVYLLEDTLVLVIEQQPGKDARASLADDPICAAWEDKMRPMKSEEDYRPMNQVFRARLN